MRTLNLGILAHVDAGKTSLTERLLQAAGVIDEIGSVDDGNTQTDTLALERRRGITIKSAVVSMTIGDVVVNLVDTPGHPDFIAEVERALGVLDGAVLVVSAVEGVQPQSRVLMRALRRLDLPTLLWVNKIDRSGAAYGGTLSAIRERLTPAAVAMGAVDGIGTVEARFNPFRAGNPPFIRRLLEVAAEHDDDLLAAYVEDDLSVPFDRLRAALAAQSRTALAYPVFFGSAITGAGVDSLMTAIPELLPATDRGSRGDVSGTVFKVERGTTGERVAYVRMFSGAVRVRDRLPLDDGGEAKVTGLKVFNGASAVDADTASAGQIAKLSGLGDVRIGTVLGVPPPSGLVSRFHPPTLETVVVPSRAADRPALHSALAMLAEQDPLINVRQDDVRQEISLSLYGEVQKEVIQATLADEFGLDVRFRQTTTVCIERPAGSGAALEEIGVEPNPFLATVGLRIDRAPVGAGVQFALEIELGSLPLAFVKAVDESARATLRQGLHGWEITDCRITMTHSDYWARQSHSHGVFDKSMSSTAGHFRNLTPLVVMAALQQARTVVSEPLHRFELEVPADVLGAVLPVLARLRAILQATRQRGRGCTIAGEIPAAHVHDLQQQLPTLTRGEGLLESEFDHYQPVRGPAPARARTDNNPLHRKEYLLRVVRRVPVDRVT